MTIARRCVAAREKQLACSRTSVRYAVEVKAEKNRRCRVAVGCLLEGADVAGRRLKNRWILD